MVARKPSRRAGPAVAGSARHREVTLELVVDCTVGRRRVARWKVVVGTWPEVEAGGDGGLFTADGVRGQSAVGHGPVDCGVQAGDGAQFEVAGAGKPSPILAPACSARLAAWTSRTSSPMVSRRPAARRVAMVACAGARVSPRRGKVGSRVVPSSETITHGPGFLALAVGLSR